MNGYATEEYMICKQWIAEKIKSGSTWDEVKSLCVVPDYVLDEFDRLQNEELIIPPQMNYSDWMDFVSSFEKEFVPIVDMYGLAEENGSNLPVPFGVGSSWQRYKTNLLTNNHMSDAAVNQIEVNSHWILNHIKRDTRTAGPVKGLVMGSVQSGKTANMIGLVTMAADYDWNFVIVLSGTIDNLRKQTQTRFYNDLTAAAGVVWHVLDHTSKPEHMTDISNGARLLLDDTKLNTFTNGKSQNQWLHRYVTVCLKNSTRLRNLIKWLQSNAARAARLRILIIDDEADQASVNTCKMEGETDEDFIERTAVNQLIIDLVNGKDEDGAPSKAPFQAVNYISFTATPYANVLNEAYKSSLYPKDFICSLPESKEYFGARQIFGSKEDGIHTGLPIIRDIPKKELDELKKIHKGAAFTIPDQLKNAICWFLCSAACLRVKGHKKPITMLIHSTQLQAGHFEEYDVIHKWLLRERKTGGVLSACKSIYEEEKNRFLKSDLSAGYPDYSLLGKVDFIYPEFSKIQPEIESMISDIVNIQMGENKTTNYHNSGIHLCIDNCCANRYAEEGTYLRVIYPTKQQLNELQKAPVFIVMGGNTLSRGLTLEGLVCTYFARNVNQADSLMQMARWFGYRAKYELLQRIWLPDDVQQKFILLEEIDEKLKEEFDDFKKKGLSPSQFGPKIMSTAKIAKFMLTSKNKAQHCVECEFDFSGDSYETTEFVNDKLKLDMNISVTEAFLTKLGTPVLSAVNRSAYVWHEIPAQTIKEYLKNQYLVFDCSSLSSNMPYLLDWLGQMNQDEKYMKWNVAVAGDGNAHSRWKTGSFDVGKIVRTKKKKSDSPDYIDIGSLRSGRDALCDVIPAALNAEEKELFDIAMKSGQNLKSVRGAIGMSDIPLILIYRIDKDGGEDTKTRVKIAGESDIIGISIIIPGESIGESHVKSVRVSIPS